MTFLITDVISEIWGRERARKTVQIGIACQLLSLLLIYITIALPYVSYMADFSEDYKDVLGSTARIVLASLVSYICAQSCDVYLFNKLRNNKVGKHKWIRNNVSTMTSQAVDTVMFITIAFFGTGANLPVMMASQYVVKFVIALLDTPIFYLLTKGSRNRIQSNDGFGYRSELIQRHHIPALLQE